jgi:hypothetical protein
MSRLGCGVVAFTHAAQFSLHIAPVQSLPDLLQKDAKRQQIHHAESCPPRCDPTECVGRCKIRQGHGDARQCSVGCTIDHSLLTPVQTPADKLERLAGQRMERMGDTNG